MTEVSARFVTNVDSLLRSWENNPTDVCNLVHNEDTDNFSANSSTEVAHYAQCGDVCQELAEGMSSYRDDEEMKTTSMTSIRDMLGAQAGNLTPVLGTLLQDRVSREELLPATQDVAANDEIIKNETNAVTLTRPAFQAALLYSQLLASPGALGSGLVDLESLTALTAVLRRWTLECCGREDLFRNDTIQAAQKSPPKKRSRRVEATIDLDSVHPVIEEPDEEEFLRKLLRLGLRVAQTVASIPMQREFSSWSQEAREVTIDAVVISYATAVTLTPTQHPICPKIVSQASESLQACMLHCQGKTKLQHELVVTTLRGLLHVLQLREVLPSGEKGKLDAHSAAGELLFKLISELSTASVTRSSRRSLGNISNQNTPSRRRSSFGNKTPGSTMGRASAQKRRTSIEELTESVAPLQSPALKGRRSSLSPLDVTPGHQKPRPVWSAFVGMLQKLATTPGLERASIRSPTVESISKCSGALPLLERAHFLRYLVKLSKSRVSIHRLVTCEVLGNICCEDWLSTHDEDSIDVASSGVTSAQATHGMVTPGSVSTDTNAVSLPKALWQSLQGRLSDKLAAVRARAALSIESIAKAHSEWLDDSLIASLRKRALKDETAIVRKSAIVAMGETMKLKDDLLSEINIATMCDLCQDSSVLTRRAASEALSSLFEHYIDHSAMGSLLEQAWSASVLPLILDDDTASKAIANFDRVIINPILSSDEANRVDAAWRLLAYVGNASGQQGSSKGSQQALEVGLKQMAMDDPSRIYTSLARSAAVIAQECLDEPEISEERVTGVWCLLEALLSQPEAIDRVMRGLKKKPSSLDLSLLCCSAWKTLLNRMSQTSAAWVIGTLRSSLNVLTKLASGLDTDIARDTKEDIQNEIMSMTLPTEVIGAAISALSALVCRVDGDNARASSRKWIKLSFQASERELLSFVKEVRHWGTESSNSNERKAVRAIFTVGELSMIGFMPDDEQQTSKERKGDESDPLRGMHEKPSKTLLQIIKTLLSPSLPGNASSLTPSRVRAHAFTVLGKLCLRDEELAKGSLNLFARELHPSNRDPNRAVQSNALIVLGDLCVKYTNMADRYLPVMASCLQAGAADPETNFFGDGVDSASIVRKHAVLLLSSLLLQDYIKWRGLLFHRFLVACSDQNEQVAALAENVLSGPLNLRNPRLFFNHFVEAIFVLNKCTAHPIYVAAATHGDGGSGISVGFDGIHLGGEVGRLRRVRMYEFLLGKLNDEEKIGITARLAKEILGGAVQSSGDLGKICEISSPQNLDPRLQSAWNVLTDTLGILTSKSMKVGRIQEDDALEDPNMPNAARQVSVAKTRLLSKISRKHLIEIVLPILCNLKVKLQASCSPLLKDLMKYLLEIFKNYRTEVREFLANDPTLLQEIEYDARKYAAEEE